MNYYEKYRQTINNKIEVEKTGNTKVDQIINKRFYKLLFRNCSKCSKSKEIENFKVYRKRTKILFENICLECRPKPTIPLLKVNKSGIKFNHDKITTNKLKTRESHIRGKYGIDMNDYRNMIIKQDGLCKICNDTVGLNIDHCHETGKVRGLLCMTCNLMLGYARDNKQLLESGIKYLENYD